MKIFFRIAGVSRDTVEQMEVSLHVAQSIPDQERLSAIVDEIVVGDTQPTKPWILRLEPEHRLSDEAFASLRLLVGSLSDDSPAYAIHTSPLTLTCGLLLRGDHVRLFPRDSRWSDETTRVAKIADAVDSGIVLHADGGDWKRAAARTCSANTALERAMTTHDCDDVRLARAAALIDFGRFQDALEVLSTTGKRGATLRAHAHLRRGARGRALHALLGADEPLLEAQIRTQLRDWTGARSRIELARRIPIHASMSVDDLQARTLLAEHDFMAGEIEAALAAARALTLARPDHGAAWFLLFDALHRTTEPSKVEQLIEEMRATPGATEAADLMLVALGEKESATSVGQIIARRRAARGSALLSCLTFPWLLHEESAAPIARPVPPKVSLTMIVRDEENNLGDCLEGAVELVDEIVVVDTGSRDATRDIARHFGATVVDFEWCDDFAVARNVALDHARGEWIFILDADDRVLDRDRALLRDLFDNLARDERAYCLQRVSLAADGQIASELEQALLFRRTDDVRWQYRVHEQITPALLRRDATFESTDIRIIHTGYRDAATLAAKAERNFRIVQKELADRPNDPFLNFSYGMMLVDQRRHADALEPLRRAESTTAPRTEMARSLAIALTRCLLAAGKEDDALATIRGARLENPGHAPVALAEAEILVGRGELDAAVNALADLPFDPKAKFDVHHARALMLLGELMIRRGAHDKAEVIGRTLIQSRPSFGGGWLVMIDACLAQSKSAELDALAHRMSALREATELRAIIEAARSVARGAFQEVAMHLTDNGSRADAIAQRIIESRARVPFATCSAAPWVQ